MRICSVVFLAASLLLGSQNGFSGNASEAGKVVELVDVGNYLYLKLENKEHWFATAPFAVKVGDTVEFSGGNMMSNFYSTFLDKTFDYIIFADSGQVVAAAEDRPSDEELVSAAHAGISPDLAHSERAMPPKSGEIQRLEGGMTVAEILAGYPHSGKQHVRLRAKVVKVSTAIMGKNWVTLQDGTKTDWANQLIATTREVVSVNDIVVVEGIIVNDVSLGFGYDYKVLMEEAVFK